jgi:hypothetical protein
MAKKIFILFLASVIVFAIAGYLFFDKKEVEKVKGAPIDAIGWAWIGANCNDAGCAQNTDPAGWISFNSTNGAGCGMAYAVRVDYDAAGVVDADTLMGYAWIGAGENATNEPCESSENTIGWLSFDSNLVPSWESSVTEFARLIKNTDGSFER